MQFLVFTCLSCVKFHANLRNTQTSTRRKLLILKVCLCETWKSKSKKHLQMRSSFCLILLERCLYGSRWVWLEYVGLGYTECVFFEWDSKKWPETPPVLPILSVFRSTHDKWALVLVLVSTVLKQFPGPDFGTSFYSPAGTTVFHGRG